MFFGGLFSGFLFSRGKTTYVFITYKKRANLSPKARSVSQCSIKAWSIRKEWDTGESGYTSASDRAVWRERPSFTPFLSTQP